MIKAVRWFLIAALIGLCSAACGSGSGDEGGCKQYCNYACSKAGVCFGMSNAQQANCESTCIRRTEEIGRSDESCRDAQASVEQMTCTQLAVLVGLRTLGGVSHAVELFAERVGGLLGDD